MALQSTVSRIGDRDVCCTPEKMFFQAGMHVVQPEGICDSGDSGMAETKSTLIFDLIFHLIWPRLQGSRKRLGER